MMRWWNYIMKRRNCRKSLLQLPIHTNKLYLFERFFKRNPLPIGISFTIKDLCFGLSFFNIYLDRMCLEFIFLKYWENEVIAWRLNVNIFYAFTNLLVSYRSSYRRKMRSSDDFS